MISFYKKTSKNLLFQYSFLIKNASNKLINVKSVFLDTLPEGSNLGTVLMIHGVPGSHKDFKYIVPFLLEKKIRVIGINFPGFGYSTSDKEFKNDHYDREQFIQETLNALNISNDFVFVGHSRGCVETLRLAAKKNNKCVGIVIANTVGLRPHRSVRPLWFIRFLNWLWSFNFLHFIYLPILNFYFNKILGFPSFFFQNRLTSGFIIEIMAHTNFLKLKEYINEINKSDIRVLIPFAGKDLIIETDVSREIANAFSHNKELDCSTKYDDDEIINEAINAYNSGQKHLSVFFKNENHFLQKHRPKFLARLIETLFKKN